MIECDDSPSNNTRSSEKKKKESDIFCLFGDVNNFILRGSHNRLPIRMNATIVKMWQRVAGCYAGFAVHQQKKESSVLLYQTCKDVYKKACNGIVREFGPLYILPSELTVENLMQDKFESRGAVEIAATTIWRTAFLDCKLEITNHILPM